MKPSSIDAITAVDRLATSDEVRAAILPFPDPIEECSQDMLCEIASDIGGYIRIPALEFEASLLIEEWIQQQEIWAN